MESINGNLAAKVSVDTTRMGWTPSPSGTVFRKRMHLVGPPEAGQVSSIVRYEQGATFPSHDHPDGEEILVLEGTFYDEHGEWPAGSYLLNPEGFRHAPFSREGCVLLVKLRQFPGREREHVAIATHDIPWLPGPKTGVEIKPLYEQEGFSDIVRLERWAGHASLGELTYEGGAEIFVLDGSFEDEDGKYAAGTWLRLPDGASHRPATESGCVLYVKRGGLRYLEAAQ
jgi:anti-sigma factor ChrR (cupin superfamily)